jgi:Taurine catabolism dioxygenase TauD, TfdA family
MSNPRAPLSGPDVWLGKDMEKRTDWIHVLAKDEIADLQRAIRDVRDSHAEMYAVTAEEFPLPVLSRRFKAISHALEQGCGVANIRGIPTDTFSLEDLRWVLWGIGAYLGTAVSQNKAGEFFAEVKDYGEQLGGPASRGYRSASSLRFHTDRCDVVALLCARQCRKGGESRIVSTPAIHNAMLERRPDLLEELFGPYYHSRQSEEVPGELPYYVNPVFGLHNGRFSSQYSRSYVESAQKFNRTPRLRKEQDEALDLLAALADELCLQTRMEPGDIQLLNNHVTYHSRTVIEDFEETEKKRLVYRLWLSTPQSRELPASYDVLWGPTDAGALRGGVTPASGLRNVDQWRAAAAPRG